MYLPGIWVYQASELPETQRKETPILTKREARITNVDTIHRIAAPIALPEAPPCRARLVLVLSYYYRQGLRQTVHTVHKHLYPEYFRVG